MPSLPKITGVKPTKTKAVEAKEYPDAFIVSLSLIDIGNNQQAFNVRLRPYNHATKELYPNADADETMTVQDIWTESARSTTFAQVMGSICQVTSWLVRERQLVAKKEPTAEEQAELATIKEYLGVTK